MYQENERTELKRNISDVIKKEIIAFLNTSGGIIYVGVDDNGKIYYDLNDKEKDIEQTRVINMLLNNVISPDPKEYIDLSWNNDGVLVINVAEGKDKPYYLTKDGINKGTYLRYETSKHKASIKEIKKLELEANKIYYEDEISDKQELHFKYLFNKYHVDDRLISLGFIKNKKYTNLAYLFSDEFSNRTKIYLIDDINNIKKRIIFKGSILKQLDDIKTYLSNISGYPIMALQEALLNAFIHRDWSLKDNIRIEINENKINFISPGSTYLMSYEDIEYGKTSYRNPKLAKLLKYLDYKDNNLSSGFNLINLEYKKYKKEPLIMATSKLFIISLPRIKNI